MARLYRNLLVEPLWRAESTFSGYAGFQFDAAFTRDRRPYDFYTMQVLNDKRNDLFVGIRVGFILPVWLKVSEKEFFYY